jgi:hypothetical protein
MNTQYTAPQILYKLFKTMGRPIIDLNVSDLATIIRAMVDSLVPVAQ